MDVSRRVFLTKAGAFIAGTAATGSLTAACRPIISSLDTREFSIDDVVGNKLVRFTGSEGYQDLIPVSTNTYQIYRGHNAQSGLECEIKVTTVKGDTHYRNQEVTRYQDGKKQVNILNMKHGATGPHEGSLDDFDGTSSTDLGKIGANIRGAYANYQPFMDRIHSDPRHQGWLGRKNQVR